MNIQRDQHNKKTLRHFDVKSMLLYGCERWRTTNILQRKLQTSFNTCLRRILGTRWEDRTKRGRQVAQSVEIRGSEFALETSWWVRIFHPTSPVRRALRRRRPYYSKNGDPQFHEKGLLQYTKKIGGGKIDAKKEVDLDRSHLEEASDQHNNPDLEPSKRRGWPRCRRAHSTEENSEHVYAL